MCIHRTSPTRWTPFGRTPSLCATPQDGKNTKIQTPFISLIRRIEYKILTNKKFLLSCSPSLRASLKQSSEFLLVRMNRGLGGVVFICIKCLSSSRRRGSYQTCDPELDSVSFNSPAHRTNAINRGSSSFLVFLLSFHTIGSLPFLWEWEVFIS